MERVFRWSVVGCAFLSLSIAQASESWSSPNWASGASAPSGRSSRKASSSGESSFFNPNVSPFAPGSNNLALDLGQVFLMGDLGSYENAIGARLHYTYGVSEMFGFDSSFGYSDHDEGRFSVATLLTGLRMNLSWYDKVIPYAVFGLGFYKPSYQVSAGNSVSPVLFGIHLGPGVDLEISKNLFFGASLTFHDMFGTTKVVQSKRLEIGGTYASFLVHAGVTF